MVKEVMESFLLIPQGTYELTNRLHHIPHICRLNADKIITNCQQRLQLWRLMDSAITSPYQRAYVCNIHQIHDKNLLDVLNLDDLKKGLSIRHLAVYLNQDELHLASNLYPHIVGREIFLHEPDPPFDCLPKITNDQQVNRSVFASVVHDNVTSFTQSPISDKQEKESHSQINLQLSTKDNSGVPEDYTQDECIDFLELNQQKIYTVVVVSSNSTILEQINLFLASRMFFVVTLNEPIQDYLIILHYCPDLILLDLNTQINGYELCIEIK